MASKLGNSYEVQPWQDNWVNRAPAQVLVIDPQVENYQLLISELEPSIELLILDPNRDGVEQITEYLTGESVGSVGSVGSLGSNISPRLPVSPSPGLPVSPSPRPPSPILGDGLGVREKEGMGLRDTLHIISHGAPGTLYLGNSTLELDNIERYRHHLQQWQIDNLILYGCSVAAGDVGEEFLSKLHSYIQANISANPQPTGNEALGGNWNLQQRWGTVGGGVPPIPIALKARAMYPGILGAGDLDTSFGTNGIITTAIGTSNDFGRAIALQPDGKIVVAGSAQSGTHNDFAAVRYNSDGTLDTSFNGTGKAVTPTSGSYDEGYGMILQPDGKIVVVGRAYTGTTWNFSLARYNSNGTLDTSFNGTGIVTTNFGSGNRYAQAVALQSDGKIVVTGYVNSDVAIARYNTDGTLDGSFGSGGTLNSSFGSTEWAEAIAIQPDGKIVIAGRHYNFIVGRYNSNGSLDGSFSGGRIGTDFAGGTDQGYAMVLQPDGKIVVAGLANNGSNNDFAVARYNSDATLDTSFNTTGKVTTAIGSSNDQGYAIALQSDGKIVVAGSANNGSNNDFALTRYNSDGTLDTSFTSNTTGKTTTAIGSSNEEARGVVLLPNGQILAAGYTNNGSNFDFALVRYGVPDITISTGAIGAATVNAGTSDYELYQLSLAPTTFSSAYTTPVTLTGVTLTTTGTYTASDISSFKLRYSADATLDAGDAILSTIAPVASGGNLTFSSLSQNINLGSTGYLFVTADIAATATDNNTIAIAAPTLSNITFLAGSNIGTPTAGNAQAIEVIPTLSNISKTGNEDSNITFTAADFSAGFNDADSLNKIQITSLPTNGTLQLSGTNVTLNQEITAANIPNLTFTPTTDYNGNTSFTWNASDGSSYATTDATANLTVTAVNDPPSFTNAGNQTLTSWTNTTQTVNNWANTFVFGPTDENSQAVADFLLNVTAGNDLFTTLPDIANDGTLTYTPSGKPGTATVQVQLKDDGGVVNGGVDTSTPISFNITIPPPTVNLSVNTTTGTEADTTAITLTATAEGAVSGNQTLNLALTGTASNSDFSGTIPAQITIADGSSTGQVTLTVANDLIDEDNETATLTISNPSVGIALGTTTAQTITITDDDTAGYDITTISGNTSETGGQATFDIKLTSEPTADVTLNFASSDTSEGTVTPSVTFDPSNWNIPQTVTITGVDDLVADGDIPYNITGIATSADTKYNNNNPLSVTVTNTDNDIPGVTVIQTGGNTELTEGSVTDTYTIALNTLPIGNVNITATAAAQTEISLDGVNFAPTQTLTFTSTNGITPQTVTVRAIDDTTPEDYHSGAITHTISNSADTNYPTTMTVGDINPHITDNDISYTLTGSSTTVTEGNSSSQQITYNITRTGAITETSTVDFSFSGTAANTIDYNLVSITGTGVTTSGSTIAFAANATQSTITVEVLGDQIDEDNETLIFSLVNPTATGTPSLIGSPVTTTITDDDTAGFTITPTSGLTTTEAGGTATFTVALTSQPTANVTINLSSDNTAEGTIDKPSLVFTAANWNTPQTVTITGKDDLVDDGNISYN
ncbi:MAG TPA: DUF4347 domain-containing protein, partial [Oscillatoriaceae cyanobacterium M33_DOE_052]|nr:DUF4347 domain-containing protein [Oscillatoriaceae cyanobacterium M33_DOE_052]